MTLLELKRNFISEISSLYSNSEIEELYYIFCEKILQLSKIECRISPDFSLNPHQIIDFESALQSLKNGIPYQQVLGEAEFYGETFYVNENVLIPRPETEELVELAIQKIQSLKFDVQGLEDNRINHQSSIIDYKILDIGTGSGIIPLILKKYFPKAEIFGMDISEKALEVAKINSEKLNVEVDWLKQDYLTNDLTEIYDVIISNPPYIGKNEEVEIETSVKNFEPTLALFSPTEDPLLFYKKIAEDCKTNLKQNGLLFLEINQKLGEETLALFKNNFAEVNLIKDLSGNDRFIVGKK